MTDARVHDPVQDEWAMSAPLVARVPVWPCAGGMVLRSAYIQITAQEVIVHLSKRAHNPLLKEARLTEPTRPVPWLRGRSVRVVCP